MHCGTADHDDTSVHTRTVWGGGGSVSKLMHFCQSQSQVIIHECHHIMTQHATGDCNMCFASAPESNFQGVIARSLMLWNVLCIFDMSADISCVQMA